MFEQCYKVTNEILNHKHFDFELNLARYKLLFGLNFGENADEFQKAKMV